MVRTLLAYLTDASAELGASPITTVRVHDAHGTVHRGAVTPPLFHGMPWREHLPR